MKYACIEKVDLLDADGFTTDIVSIDLNNMESDTHFFDLQILSFPERLEKLDIKIDMRHDYFTFEDGTFSKTINQFSTRGKIKFGLAPVAGLMPAILDIIFSLRLPGDEHFGTGIIFEFDLQYLDEKYENAEELFLSEAV